MRRARKKDEEEKEKHLSPDRYAHALVRSPNGRGRKKKKKNIFLDSNPHDRDDDIHSLSLASLVFMTPHPVFFVVPKRPARAVHAAPPELLDRVGAHTDRVRNACRLRAIR